MRHLLDPPAGARAARRARRRPARRRRPWRGRGSRRAAARSTCWRPRRRRARGTARGPGPSSASRVSAVTDAASRSTSIADASTPSTPATASSTSASRSAADATTRPRFCHGSPATTSSTRSRPSAARASAATTTWPTCTGSNVPPNTPSRSLARHRAESTGAIRVVHLGETFRVICARTHASMNDVAEPTHVLVRVWLPDRPGALGLVASRIGAVDGDIVGIDVLERGDSVAVDEFAVRAARRRAALDLLVREIEEVDGASVEEVRIVDRFPDPRLDALESAASLCAARVDRRRCTRSLVEPDPRRVPRRLERAAARRDGARVGRRRRARRVGARGAGDGHRGVAAGRRRQHRPRRPRGRVAPDTAPTLLVGRDGHPFRRRERAQLSRSPASPTAPGRCSA